MDEVQFRVAVEELGAGAYRTIEPIVNRTPLRELAAVVEASAAQAGGEPDLAGGYAGLCEIDVRRPDAHYLGSPTLQWFGDGDTVLLGCTCSEWGCWPLTAQVEVGGATVRWSGFRTGHRDWDLSALGPFEFDRAQYETAVAELVRDR